MTTRLLTPTRVAEVLHISPAAVRGWAREGKIRAVKLPNGHYRIPADALAEITGEHAKAS